MTIRIGCAIWRTTLSLILRYGLCFSIGQVALEMEVSRSSIQKMLKRAEEKIQVNKASSLFLVG